MKKILYLTTSIDPKDYSFLLKKGVTLPNPSNQNFHSRLISALGSRFDVRVISRLSLKIGPYTLLDNERYHYFEKQSGILPKLFPPLELKALKHLIPEEIDAILFDSLNAPLSFQAITIASKLGVPSIAILTDNPSNITGLSKAKAKRIIDYASKANASITLTPSLQNVYHLSNKKSVLIPGIASESDAPSFKGPRPYFYFGGSLLQRYGAPRLIENFLAANLENTDLYIAGHGNENLPKDDNVILLGQVSLEENIAYQKGAVALINPRPFDPILDSESVPSKMFEYLSFGSRIISTENTFFKKEFDSCVNWIGNGSDEDFANFFRSYKENGATRFKEITSKQRESFLEKYGPSSFAKKIEGFLTSLD